MRRAMVAAALAMTMTSSGAGVARAQGSSPTAKEAAERFSLDLAPVEEDAAVTAPTGAPLTLDTPIAELIADPRGKRVLDRDLPGLSTDKNLDKFQALSLRRLAPQTGGRLTPALLETVARDLAEAR